MTPHLNHLHGKHLGWPWSIRDFVTGTFEKVIPGDHHFAPVEIAKILSIKEWVMEIAFAGDGLPLSFTETVISGTRRVRTNIPDEDDPGIENAPGWLTLQHAIELREFPDTVGDFEPVAALRIDWNGTYEDEVEYMSMTLHLAPPRLGFTEDDDPAWIIPVIVSGGMYALDGGTGISTLYSEPIGMIYDGEQLGDEETGGWTISITPGGDYEG